MNDLELYIYIALALIYFLSRAFRQKKPKQPPGSYTNLPTSGQNTTSKSERDRTKTFEELLQEFTGYKEAPLTKEMAEENEKVEEEVVEAAEIPDEYQTYEEYDDYKSSDYINYDDIYKKSGEFTTLEEQGSLEVPIDIIFDKSEIDKGATLRAKRYRQMLVDKQSFKEAFILKELFEPKYF